MHRSRLQQIAQFVDTPLLHQRLAGFPLAREDVAERLGRQPRRLGSLALGDLSERDHALREALERCVGLCKRTQGACDVEDATERRPGARERRAARLEARAQARPPRERRCGTLRVVATAPCERRQFAAAAAAAAAATVAAAAAAATAGRC